MLFFPLLHLCLDASKKYKDVFKQKNGLNGFASRLEKGGTRLASMR